MAKHKGRPSTATKDGRICGSCKVFKPHSEFFKDPRYSFGSGGRCKACNREKGIRDRIIGLQRRKTGLPEGRKTCTRCGINKDVSEFNLCAHGGLGRQGQCKACYRHTNRKSTFGITKEQFEAMLAEQGDLCAICQKPERKKRHGRIVALSVDHNHRTGRIRGLLCHNCNARLTSIEDPEFFQAAAQYLAKDVLAELV